MRRKVKIRTRYACRLFKRHSLNLFMHIKISKYVTSHHKIRGRNARNVNIETWGKPSNFTCMKSTSDESEKILCKLQNLPLASLSTAHVDVLSSCGFFPLINPKGFDCKVKIPPRLLPEPALPASLQAPAHAEQLTAPPAEILSARGGSLTAVGS